MAEKEARRLRKRHLSDHLPVNVEDLAKAEGIRIESLSLDDVLSGMSFVKDGLKVIVVNSNHHPNRRRFTIAHELAHHCLHAEYLRDNVHVDKVVLRRDGFSSAGIDTKEMEANSFAAELLMPADELRKLRAVDINDEEVISQLAKKLKVSTTALVFRLTNIRHLGAR